MRDGVDVSDCVTLCEGVRSIDTEVVGVPPVLESCDSLVCMGRRLGESGWRTDVMLRRAIDFRGEALRRGSELLVESKLPWEMPCLQVIMRSFGGCVDTLDRRE
jgi:hypothetical protein